MCIYVYVLYIADSKIHVLGIHSNYIYILYKHYLYIYIYIYIYIYYKDSIFINIYKIIHS